MLLLLLCSGFRLANPACDAGWPGLSSAEMFTWQLTDPLLALNPCLQVFATGAWAGSPENHNGEVSCLDSWTGLSVRIPVGGLAAMPDGTEANPSWAPDVVITPIALSMMDGQADGAELTAADMRTEYSNAYAYLGVVGVQEGQYGQGVMNSGESR